jgi:hypothetical protein
MGVNAQNKLQLEAYINVVIDLLVPQNQQNLWTSFTSFFLVQLVLVPISRGNQLLIVLIFSHIFFN